MKIEGLRIVAKKEPFEAAFNSWAEYYQSPYYRGYQAQSTESEPRALGYEISLSRDWVYENRILKYTQSHLLNVQGYEFRVWEFEWDPYARDILYCGDLKFEDGEISHGHRVTQAYLLSVGAIKE